MAPPEVTIELRFLGTGGSGGRPGRGRSHRRESSLLVLAPGGRILIDVTRDFAQQSRALDALDLVLLTHGHRDATGGIPALERWLDRRGAGRVPVVAHAATLRALRARHHRLRRFELVPIGSSQHRRFKAWNIRALEVPHARDCPTLAFRLERAGHALVYASDVARLTQSLRRFAAGCDLLVIDGAMWERPMFTHLCIQQALPVLSRWPVGRVLFTQLGRSTPPHETLERWLRAHDPRAAAAWDGLTVRLDSPLEHERLGAAV